MGFSIDTARALLACALAMVALGIAPGRAQDDCPPGTLPSYNSATQTVTCIADPDAPCPPGQIATYNSATESITCIGVGNRGEATPRPQSACPSGQVPLQTADGSLHCVEITLNPVLLCAPPDRAMQAGACVWTCGDGTRPDEASGRCVCQPGLIDAGLDADGRRTCRIDTRATIAVPVEPMLLEQPPPRGPQPAPQPGQ